MLKIIDCVQGSPEWLKARLGIPTASNFDKIMTNSGAQSKQRQKYLYQLAGEAVTGEYVQGYKSPAMQRGNELEDEARKLYAFIKQVEVKQVGFCHLDLAGLSAGCSPDGLIGDNGLLEIKCPNMTTHIEYLLTPAKLGDDYWSQVQGQLYVTDRDWVHVLSYYPKLKHVILEVWVDPKFRDMLVDHLSVFTSDLKAAIKKIKGE